MMKKLKLSLVLFFIIFTAASIAQGTIDIINPLPVQRIDEPICLTRQEVEMVTGTTINAGFVLITDLNGLVLNSQTDDLNADGKWDELFFITDIGPHEKKKISISITSVKSDQSFQKRTNIRFAERNLPNRELDSSERLKSTDTKISQKYFQVEGPAWENDKVAFRNYFDARNGIDIFGKKVNYMVLDSVGLGQNYHAMQNWGMDILKVGNSLGAGAIAIKSGNSIYRVDSALSSGYKLICEGSLRSVFQLTFINYILEGRQLSITHQISIYAGTNFYESSVSISGLTGNESLVTGIVNLQSKQLETYNSGKTSYFATFDKQAYLGEYLGMAIIAPSSDIVSSSRLPDSAQNITNTFAVELKLKSGSSTNFRYYSAWELQNNIFSKRETFLEFLKNEVERIENPLVVELQLKKD